MENFKIIKTNKDWEEAKLEGYTALLSGINNRKVGSGYVACTWNNYKDVFQELSGVEYLEDDGTHGLAMPIEETLGNEKLFKENE